IGCHEIHSHYTLRYILRSALRRLDDVMRRCVKYRVVLSGGTITVTVLSRSDRSLSLSLSLYLSLSLSLSRSRSLLPDMAERFDLCLCVLGSKSFQSGRHYWEIEVLNKTEWDLGVVRKSVNRKKHTTATPGSGYWILWLRNGTDYKATTAPRTTIEVKQKPKKIGVYLDYEEGQVSFYNADDMSHLHTFTDTFTESLLPFLSPGLNDDGKNAEPLKICARQEC
uniref:B30.2/SPRY domain-containing protein n=1 Tax=Callorhinchus milii TaxID=7868 RepID=A0A4W3GTB6_CALMI